VHVTISKEC